MSPFPDDEKQNRQVTWSARRCHERLRYDLGPRSDQGTGCSGGNATLADCNFMQSVEIRPYVISHVFQIKKYSIDELVNQIYQD